MRGGHLFLYKEKEIATPPPCPSAHQQEMLQESPATWTTQNHLVPPKSRPLAVVCWSQLLHFQKICDSVIKSLTCNWPWWESFFTLQKSANTTNAGFLPAYPEIRIS